MFETTQHAATGGADRGGRDQSEQLLLALGAAQTYEEIAQTIADSARALTGAELVTLTVPTAEEHGTTVFASGGLARDEQETVGVDQLPILAFPLIGAPSLPDAASPELRVHGGIAGMDPPVTDALARFAPHWLLALMRGRAYAHMVHLAYSDPLTGLANSRALHDTLSRAAEAANARGTPLALLIIDLDDFRRYNTNWGHLVGDAALQAFARALRNATRSTDFVARVGGEEFAVLLVNSGELEARVVAAHIHEALAAGSEGLPSPFTASIGIGIYPNDVPDATSLFAIADTAVLMAKREGKNRTWVF
jgi:diguanylate cyclase (GGDEF)-like protein